MQDDTTPWLRRSLLQSVAGLALVPVVAGTPAAGRSDDALPIAPPPKGRAGEFDFLTGEWRIRHRRLKTAGTDDWDVFEGEATCWSILGGVVSIEELRIPSRQFSGMGLRLFDSDKGHWFELWTNAKGASLGGPGMPGGFRGGAAVFEADDGEGSERMRVRSTWDRIAPNACRWHQAVSRDGGRRWEPHWFMDWLRA